MGFSLCSSELFDFLYSFYIVFRSSKKSSGKDFDDTFDDSYVVKKSSEKKQGFYALLFPHS